MTVPLVEVSRGGRRLYSIDLQIEVRELYDNGDGYSLRTIRRLLIDRGVSPAPAVNTLLGWVNPRVAASDRRRAREKNRRRPRTGAFSGLRRSVDWRLERMRALDDVGLSAAAIAKVMALDCPHANRLSEHQVRYALQSGATPRPWAAEDADAATSLKTTTTEVRDAA